MLNNVSHFVLRNTFKHLAICATLVIITMHKVEIYIGCWTPNPINWIILNFFWFFVHLFAFPHIEDFVLLFWIAILFCVMVSIYIHCSRVEKTSFTFEFFYDIRTFVTNRLCFVWNFKLVICFVNSLRCLAILVVNIVKPG